MNIRRILLTIIILVISALLLAACGGVSDTHSEINVSTSSGFSGAMGLSKYLTFEDAAMMATDIVVAEFVAQRPFTQSATEFEFIVHERIFGNAADRIFVYTFNIFGFSVMGTGYSFMDSERQFTTGTQYLLLLNKTVDIYANFHEDGFVLFTDLMLDLNDPSRSTMYNEPLTLHSTGMNFDSRSLTSEEIISYVYALTRNNTPARDHIRSENLADIIKGSPYVLIVDITQPRRLAHEGMQTGSRSTDIYYTTVVEVLKGDKQVGDLVRVIFFADTVFPGERHIVSITPRNPDAPYFYGFTSRNSLHTTDQLDEIISIIEGRNPN